MKSYQKIQLIGNLGQDPKVSDNPNAPVKVSLAITEKRGRDAEETTEWFDVNVWGGSRDYVKNYLSKGSKVFIEGTLESRVYQEKKYWSVNARVVMGLDSKPRGQGGGGGNWGSGGSGRGWQPQAQPPPQTQQPPPAQGWGGPQQGQQGQMQGQGFPAQHTTRVVKQGEGGSDDPIPF